VPEMGWFIGIGWDQNRWGGEFPTKEDLDPYFPDTPIFLWRNDIHAVWCNSAALHYGWNLPLLQFVLCTRFMSFLNSLFKDQKHGSGGGSQGF